MRGIGFALLALFAQRENERAVKPWERTVSAIAAFGFVMLAGFYVGYGD